MDDLLERLRERSLPAHFDFVGEKVEPLFDPENRHKSGAKPFDYLSSWLSMLRPFAFATQDESWGELEKLLCTVMRNYVEVHRMLPEAAARIEALQADVAMLREANGILEDALQEAGDDYPGSNTQKWCSSRVKAARQALKGTDNAE